MQINYVQYDVDTEKMTSDLEMAIQFRNFILFNWHNARRKGDVVSLQIASWLSGDIGEFHNEWKTHHLANCVGLDNEGLEDDTMTIDYEKQFGVKGDIFVKKAVLDEFIKRLKNKRLRYIQESDYCYRMAKAEHLLNSESVREGLLIYHSLGQIYDAMINEITARQNDYENTSPKEISPEKSRNSVKKAG